MWLFSLKLVKIKKKDSNGYLENFERHKILSPFLFMLLAREFGEN